MKKLLSLLFLLHSVSLSAQFQVEEKIGIGFSKIVHNNDMHNILNIGSLLDISIGVAEINRTKKLSLRKELEAELFLMRGSTQSGGLAAQSYRNNLRGYSGILKLKILPQINLENQFFAIGPVIGSNLRAKWSYDYVYNSSFENMGKSTSEKRTEVATENFSRLFWGIEAVTGEYISIKNGHTIGFEAAFILYQDFFIHNYTHKNLNRIGFRVSILNPSGLLKQKKELP